MTLARRSIICLLVGLHLAVLAYPGTVSGGDVFDAIKMRKKVRCGVSEGVPGFSEQDAGGRWVGFDVDFCRAVAAAALGDPDKVIFVPLKASARFPALLTGKIDLLMRNTTWTLGREAGLKVQFPGILFYDSQGIMVPRKLNIAKAEHLQGMTVCIEKGSTAEQNLLDFAAMRRLKIKPLILDSVQEITAAFFSSRCQAMTTDRSMLSAIRLQAPDNPENYLILQEYLSKEPLGPVLRRGDDDWFTLVRWTLFALITAEEAGLTQDNIMARIRETNNPAILSATGLQGGFGPALGVSEGWGVRAVLAVGNYGEMFERNLGSRSRLKLERDLNQLWTQGGLHYAPPLR